MGLGMTQICRIPTYLWEAVTRRRRVSMGHSAKRTGTRHR